MTVQEAAARVRGLSGWPAHGLAGLAGLCCALALPPFHLLPLLVLGLPVLVWRLDATRGPRDAFGLGWLFGFGHFVGMIHWVANAFLVDVARFGWMSPFAVAGLAAVLALFPALSLALARLLWRPGVGRIAVLAACWTLGEWLRSWALTGFPWAPIGMVWMPFDGIVQGAALGGVFGLSLLALLVFGLPAHLGDSDPTGRSRGRRLVVLLLALVLVLEGLGQRRLAAHPEAMTPAAAAEAEATAKATTTAGATAGTGTADPPAGTPRSDAKPGPAPPLLRVRLVQPAIPQTDKWNPTLMEANLRRTLALSMGPGLDSRDLVIWGETAVPYSLDYAPGVRASLTRAVPPGGFLITGAPRRSDPTTPLQLWNSLFALDPTGAVVAVYDKAHLVPFGEYIPFGDRLPLRKLTAGSTDFSPGPGRRTLTLGDLPPVSPLICYEVIFPGAVVPPQGPRPHWLLNLTNDGWYGQSAGPYQHFQISRLRAIEEGLPLVRVANTGISAVISPLGRVSSTLGLGDAGHLDLPVPPPLATPTLFGRFGNSIPLTLIFFLVAPTAIGVLRSARRRP